jgi:hypothetical protein
VAKTPATNYTQADEDFQKAGADNDPFDRDDISKLASALDAHDHTPGRGALIPLLALDSSVTDVLVTNGNAHDHSGGDGAQIPTEGIADGAVTAIKIANRDAYFFVPVSSAKEAGTVLGATKSPGSGIPGGVLFPAVGQPETSVTFTIPNDYVPYAADPPQLVQMVIKPVFFTAIAGNIVIDWKVYGGALGAALSAFGGGADGAVHALQADKAVTIDLFSLGVGAQPGHIVNVSLTRQADNPGDTIASAITLLGFYITYLADS